METGFVLYLKTGLVKIFLAAEKKTTWGCSGRKSEFSEQISKYLVEIAGRHLKIFKEYICTYCSNV